MGQTSEHSPVLLMLAAFSRHESALDWARAQCEADWGPVALASPRFSFVETDYYQPSMGAGLFKQLLAFERPIAPASLVDIKLLTNAWEVQYAAAGQHEEARPLNLDPGYLTLAKLVLASTKDHAHRLYLERGIFAEVTLNYQHRHWRHHEWTFPDYRRADYHQFLDQCRNYLRGRR